ncbi:MAG: sensor histidine kinase [Gemmataceae bacterium]
MTEQSFLQRWWVRVALTFGAFTLLGLFDASLSSLYHAQNDRPIPFAKILLLGVSDWYVWALLTPLIFWLARKLPIRQNTWRFAVPLHLAVGLIFAFVVVVFDTFYYFWIDFPTERRPTFQVVLISTALGKVHLYLFVYWAILGISHSVEYYRKLRERELQATRLQGQLAQAQLQVLKMQLHPHFLFNTLNTISALIHQDVDIADRMIARLGEMLRVTLENSGTQEVPLWHELDFIEAYLEIEKARLGDRLAVVWNVDAETNGALVPNLILQPLVENAVRHGIAPFSRPGRIELNARRESDQLVVEIKDNGPGLAANLKVPTRTGLGLTNTRARLEQLYPDSHRLEVANGSNKGFAVTVVIPFREEPSNPPAGVAAPLAETLIP